MANPFADVTTGPAAEGVSTLPETLRLGAVHLTVTDLDRSVAWYQAALGLHVHRQDVGVVALGAGEEDVIVLHEDATATPPPRRGSGLYHYALLYPTREELARAALRLAAMRTPIQGASDHGTHEAIYLPDLDGNGIELAADRPRERWPSPAEEFSRGGPMPLDFDALLATVEGEGPAAAQVRPGLRVGHVHLHVGDLSEALAFYRDAIGFDVWAMMPTAAFVSAGGYHHHLGLNTWRGVGAAPQRPGVVGLRHWTIVLAAVDDVAEVRARVRQAGLDAEDVAGGFAVVDPFGMTVRIVVAGTR
ncbi:MAG TPA: VOC family protein [Baekduia sp.]|uniref:VOC family protein n=1 Tax=Baekduia sp. TaxID=2600305 RepID=UPI002D7A0FB7|nr:VOC family protein [Baekduia sp.]HET6506481.1 VOC family protein [Baekduia sp.]